MIPNRILFVDDEASLRLTFPLVLQSHGFNVRTAGTVAQALQEITTQTFDILISDLNIGEAGDGFTVVSAMRRTQPECVNFILTGFPAFESALAAIQTQVDDYLIKPAKVEELVNLIQKRTQDRSPRRAKPLMRLSNLLRETSREILETALSKMESDSGIGSIRMNTGERTDNLLIVLIEIANQLDSSAPDEATELLVESSREHGARRLASAYDISMLVAEATIVDDVVYDIVRKHFLMLDTSNLMLDLKRFNHALHCMLEQSVQAFWEEASGSRQAKFKAG